MMKMYHCTKRTNLPAILEHGLRPNKPHQIRDAKSGVYLSLKPFDWMHFVTDDTQIAGAMITVDVKGLELLPDEGVITEWERYPAFVHLKPIYRNRFIRIVVSTDEKPWEFKELKYNHLISKLI